MEKELRTQRLRERWGGLRRWDFSDLDPVWWHTDEEWKEKDWRPKGKYVSAGEPQHLFADRLQAFKHWLTVLLLFPFSPISFSLTLVLALSHSLSLSFLRSHLILSLSLSSTGSRLSFCFF